MNTKRTPSLHIEKRVLVVLLQQIRLLHSYSFDDEILADALLTQGKRFSLTNRSLTITNDKLDRKAQKLVKSGLGDTYEFIKLLSMIRTQRFHKNVAEVNEGSRDWGMYKDVASKAIDFCNEFGLSKKEGFKIYINTCLNHMNKYSIMKFPSMYSLVCEVYEAMKTINEDSNKEDTKLAHDTYFHAIQTKTGIGQRYDDRPEKYMYFVLAAAEAKKMSISVDHYIKAQFHGLEWKNGIPDPVQLIGDKAQERVIRYMYENTITVEVRQQSEFFKKFKNPLKS